jgi:acetyl-CoA C-acetyltransferase
VSTREAVICEPVRTPAGRYGGMFMSQNAVDLDVAALAGLLDRTGVPPESVQDVILGHCYPSSEAPAIGRVVALDSGLPVTVPGMQVDRRCDSGLQAVIEACLQVSSGDNDLVVAGGAERRHFSRGDHAGSGAYPPCRQPRSRSPRPGCN